MTKEQLQRTIPGFVRVEAVLNETATPIPPLAVKVPVDLELDGGVNQTIDAAPCCHVSANISNGRLPATPSSHELIMWETQILPLGVRQMPPLLQQQSPTHDSNQTNDANTNYTLDWVVVQRGTPLPAAYADYWSGNDGYYRNDTVFWRPNTVERKYTNNQGGYMATRRQLVEWHTRLCAGGFLPPFNAPTYGKMDGLDLRDVEYWSGGLQLVGMKSNACNLQRIVNLEPSYFARHVLYHTTNNKQEQLQHVRERFTRLDDLWGMLNTVRKNAQRNMAYYYDDDGDSSNYTAVHHEECQVRHYKTGATSIEDGHDGRTVRCLVATT